ncbi:MAG: VOC family protein, partial [Polyangiaceae bacterium]|nr:VOC family protein [Polyangiaceae bacterium]
MPRLTHIALHVRDLEASVAFYKRYCGLHETHRREGDPAAACVVWLAEPGRERELIVVLLSGGPERHTVGSDFAHLGFAVESREAVDAVAARAKEAGCLAWPPCEEPYPVGYYCGVRDP